METTTKTGGVWMRKSGRAVRKSITMDPVLDRRVADYMRAYPDRITFSELVERALRRYVEAAS